ncbi:cysteine hydrolase family protein [Galbibacter pacificus]|uniref:Cysteine hydrolase family protein n=1 Tax=Galbibacter pacificus TaxID=2996052 RepID=A0ABT6FPN2_9FLAO|nr:cysteine hydrolase family protein [Galbibacter pacificus]MDG3581634.1 cysteine hydrolase family protein [Galbibacter pacificus]MDG3585112.1 cysteine hydrolase family protein [Galbibacter pacificus]
MSLRTKRPALLLIDFQKAFNDEAYWGGNRNNKDAEKNAEKILLKWRELELPIYHIRHSSQEPTSKLHVSSPGFEFKKEVIPLPDETLITKNVNSAFIGTNLKQMLDDMCTDTLVIMGLTTNHCVSTTTRMAGNYGYKTILINDATAAFDRVGVNGEKYDAALIHLTTLANLKDEFADIISTKKLLEII